MASPSPEVKKLTIRPRKVGTPPASTRSKRRQSNAVPVAAESSLQIGTNPEHANAAMDYLIRAAELALRVGHRQADVRGSIANHTRLALGGDHSAWLLDQTRDLLQLDAALPQI